MKNLIPLFLLLLFGNAFAQRNVSLQHMQVKEPNFTAFDAIMPKVVTDELIKHTPIKYRSNPDFGVLPYNAGCSDCIELLDKRTIDQRYFIQNGSDGSVFSIQKCFGQFSYYDKEGNLLTIDPRLMPTADPKVFKAAQQPMPTEINLKDGFTSITLENGYQFKFNQGVTLGYAQGNSTQELGAINLNQFTAGHDGVKNLNAWTGIDRTIEVDRGKLETNYLINAPLNFAAADGWLAFMERIDIPDNYSIMRGSLGKETSEGYWDGDYLILDGNNKEVAKIHRGSVNDQSGIKEQNIEPDIVYQLVQDENGFALNVMVRGSYLSDPKRVYPIIVDPAVTGTATYDLADMGFGYNANCSAWTNYCNYNLVVTCPGHSTLTACTFSAEYISGSSLCSGGNCLKDEAGFRIYGPCDSSPGDTIFWTCDSANGGNSPGSCFGTNIDMFNTVSCLPPQAADYNLNFSMHNYQCSCDYGGCSTATCQYMPNSTWSITLTARTVEVTTGSPHTICVGDSFGLSMTVQNGVPPYTYVWNHGGSLNDSTISNPIASPIVNTTYTVTVTDNSGNTTTGMQIIHVTSSLILNTISTPFCIGDSTGSINLTVVGGTPPYTYNWSNGDTIQDINNLAAGTYTVTVTSSSGCGGVKMVVVAPDSTCVWPGDADFNGVADNNDILAIGLAFDSIGSLRTDQTISWDAKLAGNWAYYLPTGPNYKHSDCNGDGIVGYTDTLAITQNYGLTHPKTDQLNLNGNPELYLVFPSGYLNPGDNVDAQVMLGTDIVPVNTIYGIAFTIDYDASIIDTSSVRFAAATGWMGTKGTNLMGFGKNLSSQDRIDCAVTRTNQANTNGYGQIGILHFKIRSDAALNQLLHLSTSGTHAIDNGMNNIDIDGSSASVNIGTGINDLSTNSSISIYPNPASDQLFISSSQNISSIIIYDVIGKEVLVANNLSGLKESISLKGFSSGIYFIRVRTERGEVLRKLAVE